MKRTILPGVLALALCSCTPPPAPSRPPPPVLRFLRAEGREVVDPDGRPFPLRGCNSGAWLAIEPWLIGWDLPEELRFEKAMWDLVGRRFGEAEKIKLIKAFRAAFFTQDDVRLIAANGMNCLRIPVWWRAVGDPAYGGDIAYLDDCIRWCREAGIYAIVDLHGEPGGQRNWACSGETNTGETWKDERFRQQTVDWWVRVAARYRDEPAVAGYDLINEQVAAPNDELVALYDRIYKAIRAVDDRHVIILQDGLHGLHRLPHPSRMGWSNVMYSFHYYPQTELDGVQADGRTFLKYNRVALYGGVPLLAGEFNTMDIRHGGADSFRRYADAFDYFGWPWTFWTFKRMDDNRDSLWGLYGFADPVPVVDIGNDPPAAFYSAFERMRTDPAGVQPFLQFALRQPARDFGRRIEAERPAGATMLALKDAYILSGTTGDHIRIEWGPPLPNVQYWREQDRIAWPVTIASGGVYELSVMIANKRPGNDVRIWVDGVLRSTAVITNPVGSWTRYEERSLGLLRLEAGRRIIDLSPGPNNEPYINLRYALLRPAAGPVGEPDESVVRLDGVNMEIPAAGSPLCVQWMEDPSAIGYWHSGEKAAWNVRLARGGTYGISARYASPNSNTVLAVYVDDAKAAEATLPSTGNWGLFTGASLGRASLPAGDHRIMLVWQGPNPDGCGNLADVMFRSLR